MPLSADGSDLVGLSLVVGSTGKGMTVTVDTDPVPVGPALIKFC